MKLIVSALVLILSAVTFGFALHSKAEAQASVAGGVRSPVVVELFTSEGCSSCPPADQFLMKLEAEQPFQNVEIIALEEHVDYWNNLGWTDPFSSDSSTVRQYVYAGAIGNGNAYTPQMVVDGREEFVGSRERQARSAIERAASRKKVNVSVIRGEQISDGTRMFQVKVAALPDGSPGDKPEVWMAVTETGLHSDVRRGENAGEDLHHAAVVRKMRKIGLAKNSGETSFSSEEKLTVDRNWKRENVRLVVFLQEQKSKRILGAGSTLFGN